MKYILGSGKNNVWKLLLKKKIKKNNDQRIDGVDLWFSTKLNRHWIFWKGRISASFHFWTYVSATVKIRWHVHVNETELKCVAKIMPTCNCDKALFVFVTRHRSLRWKNVRKLNENRSPYFRWNRWTRMRRLSSDIRSTAFKRRSIDTPRLAVAIVINAFAFFKRAVHDLQR